MSVATNPVLSPITRRRKMIHKGISFMTEELNNEAMQALAKIETVAKE
jgi:hypothetical protein